MAECTGVRLGQSTMSQFLQKIGARLGRPRPVLVCPWEKARKMRWVRRIEQVWLDLHADVTRNHRCQTIDDLMIEVEFYLKHRNRELLRGQQRAVA